LKYLRLWLILATALGGVLAFACGGDSNNDNGNTPGPTASSTNGNGASNTPSDGGSSGDTNDELKDLAGKIAGKEAKVAYTFTTEAGGTSTTGSFTLYWKPPAAWRLDLEEGGATSSIYSKDGKSYLCGEGTCIESPTAIPLPFLSFFTDPTSLTSQIDTEVSGVGFDKSSEQIAGQDATCYKASGSVAGAGASAEYCFNDDGLLLRLDSSSAGTTFKLEATSAEGTVADADVELPYDITQIPGQ